jgi:acyl transferase domain-containing protein/acyl carrier protein/ubiquinone/menaquinone biosynthesis C-methylase UbiE
MMMKSSGCSKREKGKAVSDFLERIAKLSPKRLALLATELNSNLERLKQLGNEPIAVIGIGCRFPGGANDPDSFWQLIIEGRDAIREVPPERWDLNAFYDPDPDVPGKMSTRWGGFLDGIDQFDPEFFGISPREAAGMDPQQRLLLEVAWEALENAGQSSERLAGSPTGVFVGVCNSDYFLMRFESLRDSVDAYVATGNAHSVASGRISYILGLQGPSLSVDTACSSSLVAVHLACQSLRASECRMALAGGVNLILMPDTTMILSKSHMMAPDGRCKAFDAAADGFVRTEGCGLVALKRLSDARADGDRILALIRGTASNQDGRSSGLTAPNGPSQAAVIREALANAGLRPEDVDFIEAHGTGTSLGDPIEARALADVFGQERCPDRPLRVGSVKSNFGHAESAAGIAGLIKAVLALQHGKIPPSLHLQNLNPHIDWSGLAIGVPTAATSWNRESGRRVAGVSSFGFSGTNAHVIVSDPFAMEPARDGFTQNASRPGELPPLHLLPLAARTESALVELVRKYEQAFSEKPDLDLADVCYTAGTGRFHFEHRLAVVAADLPEAKERLAQFNRGEKHALIRIGRRTSSATSGVVFMFTGQGSQYAGMGRELFETQPVFRRELEKCAEILRPLLERPLLEALFARGDELKAEGRSLHLLDETQYTQPALFSLEYALAAMWRSWGLEPAAVLGHSVGEYVAACVAGVFSLEDGLRLIAERGRLMATLPAGGAMAVAFTDESRVSEAIGAERTGTVIACINGPANIVISGESVALDAVLRRLAEAGIQSRRLVVSHAFHSPLVDPILDSFQRVASGVHYSEPLVAIASNVTGKMASPGLMSRSEYWRGHIRNPVRFADSIRALRETGQSVFLEIGPDPVLTGMGRMTLPDAEVVWASSLKRGEGNWQSLLDGLSTLFVRGVDLEWTSLHATCRRKRVALPTYPFQRGRYWLEQKKTGSPRMAISSGPENGRTHPLLGKRLDSPAIAGTVFEFELGFEHDAFLDDHRIFGRLIMPSPAYIEMALAGAAEVSKLSRSKSVPCEATDLLIREPLFLPEENSSRIQLILEDGTENEMGFRVCSREASATSDDEDPWRTHVTGRVRIGTASPRPDTDIWSREEVSGRCSEETDACAFYDSLVALGLDFGDRFRGIVGIRRRDGEALAEIRLPESLANETGPYRIHPALLDSCFHLLGAALPADGVQSAYLLIGLERFTLFTLPPEKFWNHTVLRSGFGPGRETFSGDIRLYDENSRMVAEIVGLQLKRATDAAMARVPRPKSEGLFYDIEWREQEFSGSKAKEDRLYPTADFIPSPVLLAETANNELCALVKSERLEIYGELIPKLEALSAAFIKRAFSRMGFFSPSDEYFTTRELTERLAVIPAHRRLFERLIGILAEEGVLRAEGDGWIVLRPLEALSPDLRSEAAALKQQFPACSVEVTLLARCAERLDEVLRGTCNSLQLLFPSGDFDTADALYRNSPFARTLNTAVRHVVVGAMQDAPQGRTVRILEIGAGTGGTTSFLFPHLPAERTRYTFTDVSPLFLMRARDEFRDYPFASYELLDIEKSVGAQGFREGSFELVIAANALHATRDLRETFRNAVSLLTPGGLIILLEATTRRRWVDLTFGLTEGWWRFDDFTLRPDCPLISAERWQTLFEEAGLQVVHCSASAGGNADIVQQAILIGRKPLEIPEANAAKVSPGFWLVLGDTKGIAEELALLISERGEECLLVSQGEEYNFVGGGCTALDSLCAEDFTRLFSDALAHHKGPLKGVLNLWPVNEEIAAETTPSQWEAAQARLGGGVLHATQAFISLQSERILPGARLWFVTREAQAVSSEGKSASRPYQPAQALVWGLARVVSLEHPTSFGAVIDLDFAASPQESAAVIWCEIENATGEEAVAYRNGRRLLPRVIRAKEPQSEALTLRRDSSYLVTGGLGGLGLRIAGWLAARGAGHIVLLSRRDFPERSLWPRVASENSYYETVQSILGLQKQGARITVAQGDVADETSMCLLLNRLGAEDPPLRGIVHAALDMTSCSVSDLDLELFQRMCRAKALGGWVLNRLTLDMELDFFVLFSSTTALWGTAGLGHYAAANQALDLLAQWRHEHGLCALSVNWGTWQEMRLASEADKKQFERSGLHPMPDTQALAALERLFLTDRATAIVASIDWNALRAVYEARRARPLFAEMQSRSRTENGTSVSKKSAVADSEVRRQLQSALPARRRDILIAHLRFQAGSVLGFDPSREIELEQGLFDMGMDSLMAVELKGRLERSLGVPLPSTLTFNYPTIKALSDYLLSDGLGFASGPLPETGAPTPVPPALDPVIQPSDELSEDEISALLLKKLEQIK